jgi:hypothetical protein
MAVITAALVGCRHDTAVAAADLPDAAPPPPPAELSRFSAPLAYDFTPVLRVVERDVPTTFGSLDSVRVAGSDRRRHYAFTAERGPFVAFADGGLVHLRATFAYTARGFYKPIVGPTLSVACGQGSDRPRIDIQLATPLTLTSDWHLASRVTLESISPSSADQRDRCDVTFLHRDVTARVIEAARGAVSAHLGDIDRKVGEVDLSDRVHSWWGALSHPIRLSDGVWLMLGPQRLAIGQVTGRGHTLDVPVTLEARPAIVTAPTEPTVDTTEVPQLGHHGGADRFHILIDGVVGYGVASQIVDDALVGKRISRGARSITIVRVSVAPMANGRLAIAAAFTGDAHGALRLIGTPAFDSVRHEIAVPDLDYDLETDSRLINMYSWLESDATRAAIRDKAHFPVDDAIARGRSMLLSGLNRTLGNTLTLSASVDSVRVQGLYVTRAGIVVRGEAIGRASVSVSMK